MTEDVLDVLEAGVQEKLGERSRHRANLEDVLRGEDGVEFTVSRHGRKGSDTFFVKKDSLFDELQDYMRLRAGADAIVGTIQEIREERRDDDFDRDIESCQHGSGGCRYCGLNYEGDTEPYQEAVEQLRAIMADVSTGVYRDSLEGCVEFAYGTDDKAVASICLLEGSHSTIEELREQGFEITEIHKDTECRYRAGHEHRVYVEKDLEEADRDE